MRRLNKRTKRAIVWGICIVCIAAIVVYYIGGGRPALRGLFRDGAYGTRIDMDTSVGYSVAKYNGGVAVFGKEGVTGITNSGRRAWNVEFSATAPLVLCNGRYILAADLGGKTVKLISGGKVKQSMDFQNEVLTAAVNQNGYFAVVTKERGYKGQILLYNANGEEQYAWHAATQHILSVAIAENNKQMAAAVLYTEDINRLSAVLLFNLGNSTPITCDVGEENLVSCVAYNGTDCVAIGDDATHCFRESGKERYTIRYAGRTLQEYSLCKGGILALGLTRGAADGYHGGSVVELYDGRGALKGKKEVDSSILYLDTYGKYAVVNTESGMMVVDSGGRVKAEATLDISPRKAFLCGSRNRVFLISGTSAGMYIL